MAQTIRSSKKLSALMASKARLVKEIFARSLKDDIADSHNPDTELQQQYNSFKELLIRDIEPDQFADLYAQTIAYGMFAARSKDPSLSTFNRQEAAELIPKTNPFLHKLFHYIAGYDLDTRLSWIIDNLADVFRATDVEGILHNFGKTTKMRDPIIHFYEDFLKDYDPGLRVERGVWYTPLPVVQFIVRAVDDILKEDFSLAQGLADKSKIEIEIEAETKKTADRRSKISKVKGTKKVHRVQILDPATGTGTFLAQVVRHIYAGFKGMEGMWPQYVNQDLIPRLNGFELLMASYAMAHLKLDLLLQETGYSHTSHYIKERDGLFAKDGAGLTQERFNIFLTNTLEPGFKNQPNLFWNQSLAIESAEANRIKTQTPVMVILGNPPYSGESANKGKYIMDLMKAYKMEPGGKQKLQERNSKSINDDYVKFMRFAENMVRKTGEGIVAFINPHGFLDNPTFRGMRWHLLKTFDKIYTIDLHGNATKQETTPAGGKDDNVFDIRQGVSINLMVKTGKKEKDALGQVYHCDLFGHRKDKYAFLEKNGLKDILFAKVPNVAPDYFMVPRDYKLKKEYDKNFSLVEFFRSGTRGVETKRDSLVVQFSREKAIQSANDILELTKHNFYSKYNLPKDARDWTYDLAKDDILSNEPISEKAIAIDYRVFDKRFIVYTGNTRGFIGWPVFETMSNLIMGENFGLNFVRRSRSDIWPTPFLTIFATDKSIISTLDNSVTYPLYSYISDYRTPNIDKKLVNQFAKDLVLKFLPDHELSRLREALQLREQGTDAYSGWEIPVEVMNEELEVLSSPAAIQDSEFRIQNYFTPLDVLDYIYAVLHSPSYRQRYAEFLKTDFPRVPWPTERAVFWQLVALGGNLREIHLMKDPILAKSPVTYPAPGDNVITRKLTKSSPGWNNSEFKIQNSELGRVWINDSQYFDNVPKSAWELYIGGYQPAQKWLKDRKNRTLSMEDVQHYRKIIKALMETERLMQKIDGVLQFSTKKA